MVLEGYLRILHSEENETFDGRFDRDDVADDRDAEAGGAQGKSVSGLGEYITSTKDAINICFRHTDEDDFSSDFGNAIDDAAFLAQLSPQAVKDFGPVFLYLARERDRDMLAATIESQERVAQFRAVSRLCMLY
jgi:hypothetical protein